MLQLNLLQLLTDKGIENPNRYLIKNGISRITAHRTLHNTKASINFKLLEKLCILLQCTPNDILCWSGDTKDPNFKNQPIIKLKRPPAYGNLNQKIKNIPLHKIQAIHSFIDNLSQEQ